MVVNDDVLVAADYIAFNVAVDDVTTIVLAVVSTATASKIAVMVDDVTVVVHIAFTKDIAFKVTVAFDNVTALVAIATGIASNVAVVVVDDVTAVILVVVAVFVLAVEGVESFK